MSPASLATITIVAAMAGWLVFGLGLLLRRRSPASKEQSRNRTSLIGILIQGAGFALVWGVRRPPHTLIASFSPALDLTLTLLAILLSLSSAWLGAAAVRTLGAQWSLQARITETHELITHGPYALVRHPIYTAMLGLLLVTGLALAKPLAVVAATLLFALGTAVRVRVEERLLRAAFGEAFERYARQVPAVLPWPRRA